MKVYFPMTGKTKPFDRMQLRSSSKDDPWSVESGRSSGWRLVRKSNAWRPPTDVLETETAYNVVVEVAGMRGSEFSVTFDQRILTIRGIRTDTTARKAYHQMEIDYGEFATEVEVSNPVDASGIEATYSDGFLRVVLPKAHPKILPITD
jgi:HSP20 family protein